MEEFTAEIREWDDDQDEIEETPENRHYDYVVTITEGNGRTWEFADTLAEAKDFVREYVQAW